MSPILSTIILAILLILTAVFYLLIAGFFSALYFNSVKNLERGWLNSEYFVNLMGLLFPVSVSLSLLYLALRITTGIYIGYVVWILSVISKED